MAHAAPEKSVRQTNPRRAGCSGWPTMYDLPSEFPEEPGLPDAFHDLQPQLLSRTLQLVDYSSKNWFTGSDLNVYYHLKQPIWHKRPDWFLAVGVPRLYEGKDLRRSYVVWDEGVSPSVVVEFLSLGTEQEDLGRFYDEKKDAIAATPGIVPMPSVNATETPKNGKPSPPGKLEVYETYLKVPHYIVYSHHTGRLRYFKLIDEQYQEQALQEGICKIWLDDLQIGLGIWQGEFDEALGDWLRWCNQAGEWFLTDTERAQLAREQERQAKERAQLAREQERQAKEVAEEQVMQAAQNLLATGMTLAQVAELLSLSEQQQRQLQAEE
jgi:Uma2 family endonuclease